MTITLIPVGGKKRRLHKARLRHAPSGHGQGKWQSKRRFWRYKVKARRLKRISAASRKRNW